jgi:hypothetical protein
MWGENRNNISMGQWLDPWSRSSLRQQEITMLENAVDEKTRSIVLSPPRFVKVKVPGGKSREMRHSS